MTPAALLGRARAASGWVWAVGAGVYFLAVFHRSTLGVRVRRRSSGSTCPPPS